MLQKLKLGTLDMALPSTAMSSQAGSLRNLRDAPISSRTARTWAASRRRSSGPKLEPEAEKKGLKVLAVWENGYQPHHQQQAAD